MLRIIFLTAFAAILFFNSIESYAQTTPKRSLLALSKTNHTMSIVDPTSLKILARIPVGIDPHEVIASTDGKTAYVCIYGGGSLHEINVIDLVAKKPLRNIDTRPLFGPHDISFVNGKAWFTAEGSKAVGRYDPLTNKIDWSMGTGQDRTHMIYVTPDAKKIYTTNVSSGTVSILAETKRIKLGRGAAGILMDAIGSRAFVACSADNYIAIIDLKTLEVIGKLDVGGVPDGLAWAIRP